MDKPLWYQQDQQLQRTNDRRACFVGMYILYHQDEPCEFVHYSGPLKGVIGLLLCGRVYRYRVVSTGQSPHNGFSLFEYMTH